MSAPPTQLADVFDAWPELERQIANRRIALFLDFDGTLSPIVERPHDVELPEATREAIMGAQDLLTMAVISGRDVGNVRALVNIDGLWYAGSHGFEVDGPNGEHHEIPDAARATRPLDDAEVDLHDRLDDVPGSHVDRKRFSVAVHYREVADDAIEHVVAEARQVAASHGLRVSHGRRVVELQPDIDWDKGRAVDLLLDQCGLGGDDVAALYVGDDVTDEDAFEALDHRPTGAGFGIVVRHGEFEGRDTAADFSIDGPASMARFIDRLADLIPPESRR